MKFLATNSAMKVFVLFLLVQFVKNSQPEHTKYEPKWESLDKRPLPKWYDDVKIGIFVHWGVFSVPSFGSEWFWAHLENNDTEYVEFMKKTKPKSFTYQEFAKDFTAEFFDPNDWADLFQKSGAKYVVLTSKHHEGFTLWPSKYSFSWNAQDLGPHTDLVGDLSTAVRQKGLHFGLYHSLYEWFNPIYISDRNSNFTNQDFVRFKTIPELYEIVNRYKPEVIWSDGDWEADDTYWQSKEFLAWLYNESPVKDTVVVNDRWGKGVPCKHGDFFNCADRYNPGVLQKHKWENAMTIDRKSWGFRRNANLKDYLTIQELLKTLIITMSCGGNVLINVGPTKDGIISPIFEERLLDLGSWLEINGEAIYQSEPWSVQNDTLGEVWYTSKNDSVYAISLSWPDGGVLKLGSAAKLFQKETTVKLLGFPGKLKWRTLNNTININLPCKSNVKSNWAWTFKITK